MNDALATKERWQLSLLHLFQEEDRFFVFDGNCIGLAEIPAKLFSLLSNLKNNGESELDAITKSSFNDGELASALALGDKLFGRGFFRKAANCFDAGNKEQVDRTGISEAYLSVTNACNLACRYCFVEDTKVSANPAPGVMSQHVAKQSIDFLLAHATPGAPLTIVLWGGEPLLNADLVQFVVDYGYSVARAAGVDLIFATTTNCTRLTDAMCEFLTSRKVIVNFSIDGQAESHDLNRISCRGEGTHGAVSEGISRFLAARARNFPEFVPRARMTITHPTVNSFAQNCMSIWKMGVPVVWSKDVDWLQSDHPLGLRPNDHSELKHQYSMLRDYLIQSLDSPDAELHYPQLWWDLHRIHQRERHLTSCGAGFTGVSVESQGDIHVCYHLANRDPSFRLGSVFGSSLDIQKRMAYSRLQVDQVGGCSDCAFKYMCGGGCFAKSIFHGLECNDCWLGQCQWIESYYDHCLRLYARVMMSSHRERIRLLLEKTQARSIHSEPETIAVS
jgi:uncharacterized protein